MYSDRIQARLQDIVDNADWIDDDIAGLSVAQFVENRTRADAVERCLQRITETIIHLGDAPSAEVGLEVPWSQIRALGNRLRHEYRRIDRRVIFEIATNDVPPLRAAAARALQAK